PDPAPAEPTPAESVAVPAGPAEAAPADRGTSAPFPEYGAYSPPAQEPPPPPGDPLRGLLAGAGVALLGAVLWAVVVYLSKYEIGILAVVIGYGVGYAVHRVGG